ncbi:hypothetical protein J3R82DRAFT_8911 [Butyriboletus roseoflavus]|nr:hypothetical protein J3R82DRAFT_8911 [Butyriboletus roseoflavus]
MSFCPFLPRLLRSRCRDGDHSSSASATLKRRIRALILFVSTSLTPSDVDTPSIGDGGSTTDIIIHLLDLATPPTGHVSEGDLATMVTVAQTAIERIMNVISAREFLAASRVMLTSEDTRVRSKPGRLASFPLESHSSLQSCARSVKRRSPELIGLIRDIIERQSAGSLVESALEALKALGSTCCNGEETTLVSTLPHILKVVRSQDVRCSRDVALPSGHGSSLTLGISHRNVYRILRGGLKGKTRTSCDTLVVMLLTGSLELADVEEAALATLQSLLSYLPAFYGAKELTEIAKLYVDYSATSSTQNNPLTGLTKAISKRTSAEVLLPVLYELWPNVDKAQTKRALHAAPRPEVLDNLRPMFKVFMEALDVKMVFGFTKGEPHVISAFTELVVKLNESAFGPLFRRMHDWAFADEKATNERRITFCHVYTALLDYFKGLMNPYMSMLLRPLIEVLQSFGSSSSSKTAPTDFALWSGVITVLTKSLEADDGVFWREDKLAALLPHVLSQVPAAVHSPPPSAVIIASPETQSDTAPRQVLVACLLAMVTLLPSTSSDILKRLNLDLLMHTRSEDVRVRILALECTTAMWKAEGGKLMGFVGETATFITECAEDENDSVVREAHHLKDAVESVVGSISGL